jgi:adenylate cyclase
MAARIKIETGGQPPQEVEVGAILSIGRSSSSGICVKDTKASRNHAVIQQHGSGIHYLLDLGSANGTFVNGRRVTIPVALKSGDIINIGSAAFEYVADAVAGGATTSADVQTVVDFQHRKVTVLVADIRNYSSISEKLAPKDLSLLIGGWFKEVGTLIDQFGGAIDKFIGDCVMAYWIKTQTDDNQDYILQPLKAALGLVELAGIFGDRFKQQLPSHEFRIGVGIHAGETVMGNVGTAGRPDFTAMGDNVNVAFRLESMTKTAGKTILVGPEVAGIGAQGFEFEDLGPMSLKGKNEKIQVFSLTGPKPGN